MSTWRRIRKVWRKNAPFWQVDAGTKLHVQYLPPFSRDWKLAGSQAHQHTSFLASARRQCHSGRRFAQQGADHRQFSPVIWKCKHGEERLGAFAQCRYGERYHYQLCQEGQVSADQREREKFHGCTCAGLSCLWSHQRTPLACGLLYSQSIFLCALRPEGCGHQAARIVGMSQQQLDQSHTHEGIRAPSDIGAGILGDRSSFGCPQFVAT